MTNAFETIGEATTHATGWFSYCCAYGEYRGLCSLLSVIPACLLAVIMIMRFCQKPTHLPRPNFVWWAERVALSSFVFGCLLFLVDIVHTGAAMDYTKMLDMGLIVYGMFTLAGIVLPFVAVGFAGIVIAMILKFADRRSPNVPGP